MLNILTAIAAIMTGRELIKEATTKPAPPNQRFDYDKFWSDCGNQNLTQKDIDKRRKQGYYLTTEPKPVSPLHLPSDTIVDVERYEFDCNKYGKEFAEMVRKTGHYKIIRPKPYV